MKNSIFITSYLSPVGELIIGDYNEELCLLDWKFRKQRKTVDKRLQSFFDAEYVENETSLHHEVKKQLTAYFNEDLKEFNLPLTFAGTDFQQAVWHALVAIPFGKTKSYLQLSKQLGNVKAIRAVASANGANAISIVVPCHRIIGSNGELTGYAGGLSAKKKLLKLEANQIQLNLFS